MRHYNQIFSKKLDQTRKAIIQDGVLSALFDTPTNGTTPIREITQHNKNLFLPPDDQTNHKNLLKRWDFYLVNEFHPDNQELLRGFLSKALNLQSGANGPTGENQNHDRYVAIQFDCVQAAQGQGQTVLQSDEYKLKGNNNDDDKRLLKNTAYSMIVLVTDPISNAAQDPLDDQNIGN